MPLEPAYSSIETATRFRALSQIARALSSFEDLGGILQTVADLVSQALPAEQVSLATFDISRRELNYYKQSGLVSANFQLPTFNGVMEAMSQQGLFHWQGPSVDKPAQPAVDPREASPPPLNAISTTITYREKIFGLLNAANPSGEASFTPSDSDFIVAVANQIAMTIENSRLQRVERQQRQQVETLSALTRLLNYNLDTQQVLEMILDQLARVVEYDSASVMLITNQYLKIAAHRRFHSGEQSTLVMDLYQYLHIQEVIEQGHPVIIADTSKDARWQPLPHSDYIACWLGVPLIGRDRVIGLLNLDKEQPYFYTREDSNLALTFAYQAAIAVENAHLYEAIRQRVDQFDALRATVADISMELELPRLLTAILERAVKLLNATGGDLGLYEEEQQHILIVTSHNMGKDYAGVCMEIGEGAMGLALKNRRPVLVEDYQTWENASQQYETGPWHAVLAVPFLIGQRPVGVIGIVHMDINRRFTTTDEHLLGLFAQHAAIAVENARLYQEARESAERRAILHHVSHRIVAANLNPEEIYTAIHQAAGQLMSAEAFVITRYNENKTAIDALYLIDRSGRAPFKSIPASSGLSGQVMESGEAIYIPDLLQQSLENAVHFGDTEEVRCILAVPMRLRGEVVGMISAQSYQPNAYDSEDRYLLEMLAAHAAIALDNAQLFRHIQLLAITDSGTGIYNRRHLFELGYKEFQRSQRFNRPMAAVMMDLDYFKQVNDTYGHVIGDAVLRLFGQVLVANIREVDVAARYGGEEFIVLLPETGLAQACEVAERLRRQIKQAFEYSDYRRVSITASFGVAASDNETPDFNSLVEYADLALYNAKQGGRNRVAVWRGASDNYNISIASPNE